jgi:hypothetical protein
VRTRTVSVTNAFDAGSGLKVAGARQDEGLRPSQGCVSPMMPRYGYRSSR